MHVCMMQISTILDVCIMHVRRMQEYMRHVSMMHVCVMDVKNGDGRTNGKLNSRSRMLDCQGPLLPPFPMPGMVPRLLSTGPPGEEPESSTRSHKHPKCLRFMANSSLATAAKIQVQLI